MDFGSILNHTDGNLTIEMNLLGKTYQISSFSTSFTQPTDEKLEPQSEVSGGVLSITMTQTPDKALLQWASSPYVRRSGEIVFRNETGTPPLRITFSEAICLTFSQRTNDERGTVLSLSISSQTVSFNHVVLEKA